jgi:hypothetical protein
MLIEHEFFPLRIRNFCKLASMTLCLDSLKACVEIYVDIS